MATTEEDVAAILAELRAFERATDWYTRAMHLNSALLYAAGERHLTRDLRERLVDAERRFLAESPK